ncbi:MAG: transposase domain-containing protein, partial [Idiomarina sp.]|nr:transposase domain-containing protein [Idiomarina sp.]
IPIDNNGAENGIRPFVVGRKNWLFADTPSGATASARWYSIIETAKATGQEPYHYLRYLFAWLPVAQTDDEIDQLMPWRVSQSEMEAGAVT